MNKKHLFLKIGSLSLVTLPIGITISCGTNATVGDLKVIKMNFDQSNAQQLLLAVKEFKNDIYDAKLDAKSYKNFEIDLSLPITDGDYKITLDQNEFQDVQNGKINDSATTQIPLHDYIGTMKNATGTLHQYSFNKDDAVKLGLDNGGKSPLHLIGTDQHDEVFQKQWVMDNLIKELPIGIEINAINVNKVNNNITVTFKDTQSQETKDIEFHLKAAKTQAEADADNATGGSWFYKAFKAMELPIQKIVGEVKTLAHYGKTNSGITEKDFFTSVAETVADVFVDKLGKMIPIYGEITEIPMVGERIQSYVNSHITEPLIQKIANKI